MEGYGNGAGYAAPKQSGLIGASLSSPSHPPAPTRRPLVGEQLDAAMNGAEVLHQLLTQAEDRFSPVMRPDAPQASVTGAQGREHPGVPIAASLMEINARIEAACSRLASLIQRAEC